MRPKSHFHIIIKSLSTTQLISKIIRSQPKVASSSVASLWTVEGDHKEESAICIRLIQRLKNRWALNYEDADNANDDEEEAEEVIVGHVERGP